MITYVAYYRVSTDKQGASGLGLDAQRAAVAAHMRAHPGVMASEYIEVESGKQHKNRPKLMEALAYAERHKAVLIIAKLDRLARNVAFIASLMDRKGVEFVACDFPEANRLMLHVLAAVAEHEAVMISNRTKQALAAAKARGVVLGGGDHHGIARAAWSKQADLRKAEIRTHIDGIVKRYGITSLSGIAYELNARKIPTTRGGQWSATQVSRVMDCAK